MVFSLFKNKKQYLILDIGHQNTKMMVCKPGETFIEKIIIKKTPEKSIQFGEIVDGERLVEFLSQCVDDLELETAKELSVITALSGKNIIAKKIDISPMDESLIPEYVEVQAEQELFYDKDEKVLDYEILEGVNFEQPKSQSLFIVTALKKTIENYNSIISNAFMDCSILDTNFTALFNAFEYNENLDSRQNYMVIDIGCVSTSLLIVINKQIVFVRNLPMAGDFFTQGIQNKMSIDYQEAEELKISASTGGEVPEEVASTITSDLNTDFCEEFLTCYELYHSLFPKKEIHCAYITGGGSRTLGLTSALQENLGFSVNHFNPFQKIGLTGQLKSREGELQDFSAVASGLVVRAGSS